MVKSIYYTTGDHVYSKYLQSPNCGIIKHRCPYCKKAIGSHGHTPDNPCKSPLVRPGRTCPRCTSTVTIRSGLNIYGIQIWRCKECKRCFVEHKLPRETPLNFRKPLLIVETYGRCLKCRGKQPAQLANGLCVDCFDEAKATTRLYYRRRVQSLCVGCGNALDQFSVYCSSCSEKIHNRISKAAALEYKNKLRRKEALHHSKNIAWSLDAFKPKHSDGGISPSECPYCSSSNNRKYGYTSLGKQRIFCNQCFRTFLNNGNPPKRRYSALIFNRVLELTKQNLSESAVLYRLKDEFNISPSSGTIHKWICEAKNKIKAGS